MNLAFVLLGFRVLDVEPWTARVSIAAVFGEIVALVLRVVKHLFTPTGDTILKYMDERKRKEPRWALMFKRAQYIRFLGFQSTKALAGA